MAQPPPRVPESPRPWYAGLIGFIVAALVVGALAASTAASYNNDGNQSDDHAEDTDDDHAEDDSAETDDDHADE